jgi:hypothetical protein
MFLIPYKKCLKYWHNILQSRLSITIFSPLNFPDICFIVIRETHSLMNYDVALMKILVLKYVFVCNYSKLKCYR